MYIDMNLKITNNNFIRVFTLFFTLLKKSLTISDHRTLMVLFGSRKFTHPVGGVVYITSHGFNQSDKSQTVSPDNWYTWRAETTQSSRTRLSHMVLKFFAHSIKENVHLCNITQGNGEQNKCFFILERASFISPVVCTNVPVIWLREGRRKGSKSE